MGLTVFDMDSHLEEFVMDEAFALEGPFAHLRPMRLKNESYFTANDAEKTPSAYIKKNCYVTCEADERDLRYAIEHFSEDRILMASDYPHFDSEYPGTVREIMERNDITKKQKEKILSGNAREFLRV